MIVSFTKAVRCLMDGIKYTVVSRQFVLDFVPTAKNIQFDLERLRDAMRQLLFSLLALQFFSLHEQD